MTDVIADKKNYQPGDIVTISCNLANTGNADGDEVVQVYVGMPKSKVERAVKELKAFGRMGKCDHNIIRMS